MIGNTDAVAPTFCPTNQDVISPRFRHFANCSTVFGIMAQIILRNDVSDYCVHFTFFCSGLLLSLLFLLFVIYMQFSNPNVSAVCLYIYAQSNQVIWHAFNIAIMLVVVGIRIFWPDIRFDLLRDVESIPAANANADRDLLLAFAIASIVDHIT